MNTIYCLLHHRVLFNGRTKEEYMITASQPAKRGAGALAFFKTVTALVLILLLSACATVGRNFSTEHVRDIQIGKTTQSDVEAMFGQPWRVGIEDGRPTWTYGRYHYSAFGQARTKDLVVRFDAENIVRSYTFSSTNPADLKQ